MEEILLPYIKNLSLRKTFVIDLTSTTVFETFLWRWNHDLHQQTKPDALH